MARRSSFQGVVNIVRFNWHFYVLAVVGVAVGLLVASWLGGYFFVAGICVAVGVLATTIISLLVSWYVYDKSELYRFGWLPEVPAGANIVNIHAGFDETSSLLADKYPTADLRVLDFYDPKLHTEVSIKRARRAYPPYPGTLPISTTDLGLEAESIDMIFLLLAAHEIRQLEERAHFFQQIRQALKPGGHVILTERRAERLCLFLRRLSFFAVPRVAGYFFDGTVRARRSAENHPFPNYVYPDQRCGYTLKLLAGY
jgi:SAM-dependent methyltransferase